MSEIYQFLTDCKIFYIATCSPDGPKVRPFGFVMEDSGKLYFSTGNSKDVCKQLQADPRFEISATSADGTSWIRFTGKAVFDQSMGIREKAVCEGSVLLPIYKTPDNPELALFYADDIKATIYSFMAEPREVII